MKDDVADSLSQLRKENVDLRHELQTMREQLRAETTRADVSEKSARDAWLFAKTALKTGRT
jgi:cell division septum initiation protein DivIVA